MDEVSFHLDKLVVFVSESDQLLGLSDARNIVILFVSFSCEKNTAQNDQIKKLAKFFLFHSSKFPDPENLLTVLSSSLEVIFLVAFNPCFEEHTCNMRSLQLQAESNTIFKNFNDCLFSNTLDKFLFLGSIIFGFEELVAAVGSEFTKRIYIGPRCTRIYIQNMFCYCLLVPLNLSVVVHGIQIVSIFHEPRFFYRTSEESAAIEATMSWRVLSTNHSVVFVAFWADFPLLRHFFHFYFALVYDMHPHIHARVKLLFIH